MARPKARPKGNHSLRYDTDELNRTPGTDVESKMVRGLDELALYEELTGGLLGTLKRDLAKGLTSAEIMKKYAALAAARTVNVAATDKDSGKALAASKDILDRAEGKAVERRINVHQMADLKDEELDALLLSKLKEVGPSDD